MRYTQSSCRYVFFTLFLIVFFFATPLSAASQPKPSVQAQEVELQVHIPAEGRYRIGSWLPISITVSNQGIDFIGDLRVQTSRTGADYSTQVDLPRNSQKTVTIYTYLDRLTRRLTIKLLKAGEQIVEQSVRIQPHSTNDFLIGLLSAEQSQSFPLPSDKVAGKSLVIVPITPSDLPHYYAGLSSFKSLLIDGVDLQTLAPSQLDALRQWINLGGQLIINGNSRAPDVLAGLPEALRPAIITGRSQSIAQNLFPTFLGEGEVELLDVRPTATSKVQGNSALSGGSDMLLYQQQLGHGNVVLSRINLSNPLLANWPLWAEFWHDLVPQEIVINPGIMPNNATSSQFIEGNIASNLTRLSALELPSLTLLGVLLLVYCILVGPVTFFILRKLDRQALGWVIVPTITLIFAGIAYGVGYSRRGGDAILNEITLIEPIDASSARVRAFVGVFSPSNQTFELSAGEQGLIRPISTLGVWDTSELNGVYADSRARELELKQWSMRSVMADSIQAFKGLEASISLEGLQYHAEVTNRSDYLIRDVAIVHDVYVAEVGDLQPGESKQLSFGSTSERERRELRSKFQGYSLGYLFYHKLYETPDFGISSMLPPELQIRQGLLDSLWPDGFSLQRRKPLLIGWSSQQPVQVSLNAEKVERQQTTIIVQEIPVEYKDTNITFDQAWLSYSIQFAQSNGSESLCYLSQGPGVSQTSEDLVHQLQLPVDVLPAQIEAITLLPSADGTIPNDIRLEVYDWTNHEWVEFAYKQRVSLDQPERFIDSAIGKLRVRILATQNLQTYMCVTVNAEIVVRTKLGS